MHRWQGTAHLKAIAEIADGRQNDLFNLGGIGLNGHGFVLSL
jgi:flagellar basal body P-ring protein FlgI